MIKTLACRKGATISCLKQKGDRKMGNDIFNMMERVMMGHLAHLARPIKAFLPYDVTKDKTGKIAISMAVAGYTKDNLEVTYRDGLLEVVGKGLPHGDDVIVVYQGLSKKNFHVQFPISPMYTVDEVELKDGMLTVSFKRNQEAIQTLDIKTS